MILIQGKGVSKGVAKGPLYFYQRPCAEIPHYTAEDLDAEKSRLSAAQAASIEQLEALAEKSREETGDETAILFETHAMFVEDEDFVGAILEVLEAERRYKEAYRLSLELSPHKTH